MPWKSLDHPLTDAKAVATIVRVEIAGYEATITNYLGSDTAKALGDNVEVEWLSLEDNDGENGIVAVHLNTSNGVVRLD